MGSCSFSLFTSYHPISEAAVSKDDIKPWFRSDTSHYLFHANIGFYRNQYSGLLYIKPYTDSSYRVLLITEVGIKVLDMEVFHNGDYKLYYCMDAINRKSLIKTLHNDIGLIVNGIPEQGKIQILKDHKTGRIIIQSKRRCMVKYYMLSRNNDYAEEILQKNGISKKVNALFYSAPGGALDSVVISHYTLKLKIQLSKLHENKSEISE